MAAKLSYRKIRNHIKILKRNDSLELHEISYSIPQGVSIANANLYEKNGLVSISFAASCSIDLNGNENGWLILSNYKPKKDIRFPSVTQDGKIIFGKLKTDGTLCLTIPNGYTGGYGIVVNFSYFVE